MRLDARDKLPTGMDDYLSYNGWHFNKKLCEYACRKMKKGQQKLTPWTEEEVRVLLAKYNVVLDNDNGYDAVYVANMAKADFMGSSLANEQQVAKYVKDYMDDVDGYEEIAMTR